MTNPSPSSGFTPINAQSQSEMDAQNNVTNNSSAVAQHSRTIQLNDGTTAPVPSPPVPQTRKKAAKEDITYRALAAQLPPLLNRFNETYEGPENKQRRLELNQAVSKAQGLCMKGLDKDPKIPTAYQVKVQMFNHCQEINKKWDKSLTPIDTTQLRDIVSRAKNHLLAVNDKRCKLVKLASPIYDECTERLKVCTSEEEAQELWETAKTEVNILKQQYRKKDAPPRPAPVGTSSPVLTIPLELDSRGFGRLNESMSETVKKAREVNMAAIHKQNAARGIPSPFTVGGKRVAESTPITTTPLVFKRPKNKAYAPIQHFSDDKPWQLVFYQAFSWFENEIKVELGEEVVEGLKPVRDHVRQELGFHVDKLGRLVFGNTPASKLTKANAAAAAAAGPISASPGYTATFDKGLTVTPKPQARPTTAGQISGAGYERTEADFAKAGTETDITRGVDFLDDFDSEGSGEEFMDVDDNDAEDAAPSGSATDAGHVGGDEGYGMEEL